MKLQIEWVYWGVYQDKRLSQKLRRRIRTWETSSSGSLTLRTYFHYFTVEAMTTETQDSLQLELFAFLIITLCFYHWLVSPWLLHSLDLQWLISLSYHLLHFSLKHDPVNPIYFFFFLRLGNGEFVSIYA